MPRGDAMLFNSGRSLADRPGPVRRRRGASVESAPPASAVTRPEETSDVTSVVSLNGFLPSLGRVAQVVHGGRATTDAPARLGRCGRLVRPIDDSGATI